MYNAENCVEEGPQDATGESLGVGVTPGADSGVEFSVPQAPPEEDGVATDAEEWEPEVRTFGYDPDVQSKLAHLGGVLLSQRCRRD